jgi:hypothetical protein
LNKYIFNSIFSVKDSNLKNKGMLQKIYYSLPIQLLINHFKKNQIILLPWAFLFACVSGDFGRMVGVPYLFLDAEYLDKVNFTSFYIVGLMIGSFSVAFHITTFILDSYKYKFLGYLNSPLKIYTYNNSTLPVIFIFYYCYELYNFQIHKGLQNSSDIFLEIAGLYTGFMSIYVISIVYFQKTSNLFFQKITSSLDNKLKQNKANRKSILNRINERKKVLTIVTHYFTFPLNLTEINHNQEINKQTLVSIFDRNHLHASTLQIVAFALILIMGAFSDFKYFVLPAAASAILLITILLLFIGALSYWLRGWAISAFILGLVLLNFVFRFELIKSSYEAFGIDYQTDKAEYNLKNIQQLSFKHLTEDSLNTIQILNNWKNKFNENEKPKMIFVCTSGGGQRSAAWTVNTLQTIDSATNFKFSNHTQLITGASGGLIGAAYYRELLLQHSSNSKINPLNRIYFNKITQDILNPVIFNMVVNDILFRYQKFNDGKYVHIKDRGYAFEKHFNDNIDSVLCKPISAYSTPELEATIPMLFISPTITNDGRKLFISPTHTSYMNVASNGICEKMNQRVKGVEFLRFYKNQDASNLNFMSALRMSATFPYVMPNVVLPSTPQMEIMDAGLADNFGITNAVKFMYVFKDWIRENTSGVIIVSIRDSEKELEIERLQGMSLIQKLLNPIGNIIGSWDYLQDNNNDNYLDFANQWLKCPLDVCEFKYLPKSNSKTENASSKERASLSWHLAKKEKESIRNTIYLDYNKNTLKKLQNLLK